MAKRGLGRGLNALIPSMGKPSESESNVIVELYQYPVIITFPSGSAVNP